MTTYLALLRAVNVGGNSKLPMKELRERLTAAGFGNVRTFIQSGNIILDAEEKVPKALREQIFTIIKTDFNVTSPVILLTRAELEDVIANNPCSAEVTAEKTFHVMFLADLPDKEKVAALDPNRSPGDEYRVVGRAIYLKFGVGIGKSKLTNAYFDSKLGTVSTARNWRTTNTLLEMMDGN